MNIARLLVWVASALLAAACSPTSTPESASTRANGPASPARTSNDDPAAKAAALVGAIAADRVRVLREMSQDEYAIQRRLLALSGIEESLGGPYATDAALRALMREFLNAVTTEADARPRKMAAGDPPDGTLGVAAAVVELTGLVQGVGNVYGDGRNSAVHSETDHGIADTIVENGSVNYVSTKNVATSQLAGALQLLIQVKVCPDAQGKVILEVATEMRIEATGGRGTNLKAHVKLTRDVTDDARYGEWDAESRVETASFGPTAGAYVDLTMRVTERAAQTGESRVNRSSSHATGADVKSAGNLMMILLDFAMANTELLRSVWEGGTCVQLEPTTTPARRTRSKPSTTFEVLVAPRSKVDGTPTGGTVRATLTGASAVNPADTRVAADARFGYVAPGERDRDASIAFEARSKRGIGKATLAFDTRASQAYSIEGGADEFHGAGVACDLGAEFSVQGSGVTVRFTPSSAQGGSYTYTGNMSGFPVWGNGTYSVTYQDEVAVSLKAQGPGSVKTPKGTFTRNGSETYTLTPQGDGCGA